MGTYVYKTLAKHVKTELGNVHEAKYVTKIGCAEASGRAGKQGEHLFAYGLEELETVYLNKGHGGGFWHDGIDFKVMGYLRKSGRSWYVSLREPTTGEWVARDLKDGNIQHESSGCYEFRSEVMHKDNISDVFRVNMLINTGEGTRMVSHVSVHPHTIGTFIDKHMPMAKHPIEGSLATDGSMIKAAVAA